MINPAAPITASQLLQHFLDLAKDYVDPSNTCDKIVVGDPGKEIRSVLVTWMPGLEAMEYAAANGFDMIMGHEPAFYHPRDEDGHAEETAIGIKKKAILEDNGIVLMRNHDVWDRFPKIGIPWAWGEVLGLGSEPVARSPIGYEHAYDLDEPMELDQLAKVIAGKTSLYGESIVQIAGDPKQKITRLGIGTGCLCGLDAYKAMGCDGGIMTDDGACYWGVIQRCKDEGFPVIKVNHGTSEEPGMETLARFLKESLPELKVEHLKHGCCYRVL